MAFMQWEEKYSVGVREIDEQHKQLINMLSELYEAMQAQKTNDILGQIITKLVNYTKTHFSAEEGYMQRAGYPAFAEHKKEHDNFTNKVLAFKSDFDSGKTAMSVSITSFLKTWLNDHILGNDKKYAPYLAGK